MLSFPFHFQRRIAKSFFALRHFSRADPAPGSPFHLALPVHSMKEGDNSHILMVTNYLSAALLECLSYKYFLAVS